MRVVKAFFSTATIASSALAQCPSATRFYSCIAPLATVTCASGNTPCGCSLVHAYTGCASSYCPIETLSASIMSAYTVSCLGGNTACPSPTPFSRCVAPLETVTCALGDARCGCSLVAALTGCASSYCPIETLSASIMSAYTTTCLGGNTACPSLMRFSSCTAPLETVICASGNLQCDCSLIAAFTKCASSYCPTETLLASIMSEYTTSCLNSRPPSSTPQLASMTTSAAAQTTTKGPAAGVTTTKTAPLTTTEVSGGGSTTTKTAAQSTTKGSAAGVTTSTAAPTTTEGSGGGGTTSRGEGVTTTSRSSTAVLQTTASQAGADTKIAVTAWGLVACILGILAWL